MSALLLLAVSLVAGVPATPAASQVPDLDVRGVMVWNDFPLNADADGHTLAVNRHARNDRFGDVYFGANVTCNDEVHPFAHIWPADIEFSGDDDVTDGFGNIGANDLNRGWSATSIVTNAGVAIVIEDGRFHRVGNVMEVELLVEIELLTCHETGVPLRATFVVTPGINFGEVFLVGPVVRHGYVDGDRTPVARAACGAVSPHSTRVTAPPPAPEGRGPFHPCPPEGQA